MKTRIGFVSNSSSASFIVTWRCRGLDSEDGIELALGSLFDLWNFEYDDEEHKIDWGEISEHDTGFWGSKSSIKKIVTDIMEQTEDLGDGKFKTTIWTSMMNDFRDFGPNIQHFMMAMAVQNGLDGNKNFEVLHQSVESDY